VAAFRVAEQKLGLTPGAAAGHSLGEYSALVAIGSINLTQATQWVRKRGQSMQQAVPAGAGGMAAVLNLEDDLIFQLCEKAKNQAEAKRDPSQETFPVPVSLEPANFNAPGQVVIAGSIDALQEAMDLLKTDATFSKGKAIPLQVSAPFHCQLMGSAREQMAQLFADVPAEQQPRSPRCPYVPNVTGRLIQEPGVIFKLLIQQVDHPVLWKQSISTLLERGFHTSIEFGPGKILSGLIRRIATPLKKSCKLGGISDTHSLKELEQILKKANKNVESDEPIVFSKTPLQNDR
jgi:[acyl-carrier-protein] S-malonyltransferase